MRLEIIVQLLMMKNELKHTKDCAENENKTTDVTPACDDDDQEKAHKILC